MNFGLLFVASLGEPVSKSSREELRWLRTPATKF